MAIQSAHARNISHQSIFTCQCCGKETFPLQRRRHGGRSKNGHVKHMWCQHCKKITGQIENIQRY